MPRALLPSRPSLGAALHYTTLPLHYTALHVYTSPQAELEKLTPDIAAIEEWRVKDQQYGEQAGALAQITQERDTVRGGRGWTRGGAMGLKGGYRAVGGVAEAGVDRGW